MTNKKKHDKMIRVSACNDCPFAKHGINYLAGITCEITGEEINTPRTIGKNCPMPKAPMIKENDEKNMEILRKISWANFYSKNNKGKLIKHTRTGPTFTKKGLEFIRKLIKANGDKK